MDLSIVIPSYNEERNLPTLIEEIIQVVEPLELGYEILVVDDNSTDNTPHLLKELRRSYPQLRYIRRRKDKGVGNTLREGFKNARGRTIITMDGDLSHNPHDIPRFCEEIEKGYDIVIGSRYMRGGYMGSSLSRRIISRSFSLFIRLLRLGVRDATSGYRAHIKKAIEGLDLKSTGFEIHVELPLEARKRGLQISEIPIRYVRRKTGKSNLRYFKEGPRYLKVVFNSILES